MLMAISESPVTQNNVYFTVASCGDCAVCGLCGGALCSVEVLRYCSAGDLPAVRALETASSSTWATTCRAGGTRRKRT